MQIFYNVGPVTTFSGPITFNYEFTNNDNVGPCNAYPHFPYVAPIDFNFGTVTIVNQAVAGLSNADGTNHLTYFVTLSTDPGNTTICQIDILAFAE